MKWLVSIWCHYLLIACRPCPCDWQCTIYCDRAYEASDISKNNLNKGVQCPPVAFDILDTNQRCSRYCDRAYIQLKHSQYLYWYIFQINCFDCTACIFCVPNNYYSLQLNKDNKKIRISWTTTRFITFDGISINVLVRLLAPSQSCSMVAIPTIAASHAHSPLPKSAMSDVIFGITLNIHVIDLHCILCIWR